MPRNEKDYTDKLIQSLREVPLSEEQIAAVTPKLLPRIAFLTAHDDHPPDETSSIWQFKDKIELTAKLIGVEKEQYIEAAVAHPQLFTRAPETLNDTVTKTAEILGIYKCKYAAAALKKPALFYQKPDTIATNVAAIRQVFDAGLLADEDLNAALLKTPTALCCAPKNTLFRGEHAHLRKLAGKPPLKLASFYSGRGRSQKDITADIPKLLQEIHTKTGQGRELAQDLFDRDVIKELPELKDAPAPHAAGQDVLPTYES